MYVNSILNASSDKNTSSLCIAVIIATRNQSDSMLLVVIPSQIDPLSIVVDSNKLNWLSIRN